MYSALVENHSPIAVKPVQTLFLALSHGPGPRQSFLVCAGILLEKPACPMHLISRKKTANHNQQNTFKNFLSKQKRKTQVPAKEEEEQEHGSFSCSYSPPPQKKKKKNSPAALLPRSSRPLAAPAPGRLRLLYLDFIGCSLLSDTSIISLVALMPKSLESFVEVDFPTQSLIFSVFFLG